MPIMTQRLYDFFEDMKANLTRNEPISALRAVALDALLLSQELENAQTRSDSDEVAMTDRALLEKAAKAAAIDVERLLDSENKEYFHNWEDGCVWNPLIDDGDALRLAVKLEIAVRYFDGEANAFGRDLNDNFETGPDPYAATRRAIVRAAAAIGETL